jgi:hypothetical protein
MQDSELGLRWAVSLAYSGTPQSFDIFNRLLPEWADRFCVGQIKYENVDDHLGSKGVFPDINRKVGRLERDIWDGRTPPPGAEPTREVIMDLIGHLFLMLHMEDDALITGLEEQERSNAPWEHAEGTMLVHPSAATFQEEMGSYRLTPQCPNPHAHGDGWEDLPEDAREVLRAVARSRKVTDAQREAVGRLVEDHDAPQSD